MSNRNNEEARATIGGIRKLVFKAQKSEEDPWVVYALAASLAAGGLRKEGLSAERIGELTVLAAQCYELAGAPRVAATFADQGLKMGLSAVDLSILRAIKSKAMVAV
jgi:hypothetical protein